MSLGELAGKAAVHEMGHGGRKATSRQRKNHSVKLPEWTLEMEVERTSRSENATVPISDTCLTFALLIST